MTVTHIDGRKNSPGKHNMIAETPTLETAFASEECLRLILEHAPFALAMFDREMRYICASRRWMTNYSMQVDPRGRLHYELFPELPEAWREAHRRGMAGETLRADEDRFVRLDGTVQWVRWEIRPWRDPQGEVGGIVVFTEDITARKRTEEELRLREAILEGFFEASPVTLAIKDDQFRYVKTDALTPTYFGMDRQSIIGKSENDLSPEFIKNFGPMMREVIETGVPRLNQEIHGPVPANPGKVAYLQASFFPLTLPDKKRGIGVVGVDITELKQTELALRESESKFRAVLAGSRDVIYRLNLQTNRYDYFSPSAEEVLGYSPEELASQSNDDALAKAHPEDVPALLATIERMEQAGTVEVEYRYRTKSGEFRWLSNHMGLTRDADGKPLYHTGNIRDITDRKRAEEALIRSEKLASMGRMAAAIAHEINNPLDAVTNLMFLAATSEDLPESVRQLLQMADEELKRVSHIARQSLGFYRESNAPQDVSLTAVLQSSLDILKSKLKTKQAVVQKEWDGEVRLMAVAGELRQVFSNLLANSLDAIPNHGTIKLRVSQRDHHVRITIADNGKGMTPDVRQHIFDPFFTTKGAAGTGLGLWVSKQIIDKHHGTVRVRSNTTGPRKGTVFSIVLPTISK